MLYIHTHTLLTILITIYTYAMQREICYTWREAPQLEPDRALMITVIVIAIIASRTLSPLIISVNMIMLILLMHVIITIMIMHTK